MMRCNCLTSCYSDDMNTTNCTPVRTFGHGTPRKPQSEAAAAYAAEKKARAARQRKQQRNNRFGRFDAEMLKAEAAANKF